jgi:hypothetical protein
MSQQAIHFRDQKSPPRKPNTTTGTEKGDNFSSSSGAKPTRPQLASSVGSSLNLFAPELSGGDITKTLSSAKYQNSRTVDKVHKSAIFNACASISLRGSSHRNLDIGAGNGGSVRTAHTSTSFNSTRSLLQYDLSDEGSVLPNTSSGTQIKKYFGASSRDDLYERHHWLAKKQQIMNRGGYGLM